MSIRSITTRRSAIIKIIISLADFKCIGSVKLASNPLPLAFGNDTAAKADNALDKIGTKPTISIILKFGSS